MEASGDGALDIARDLWRMRLAGWFQVDAVRSALGNLRAPVVLNVDCGHVPPQLVLVNGAVAELSVTAAGGVLTQHLG